MATSTKVPSIHDLFLHELGDLLDAEQQILKALPRMIKASFSAELRDGFIKHEKQTHEHVARLKKAFALLDEKPKKIHCKGMKGVLEEGAEVLKTKMPKALKDAALIGAAQRVEHYEMAGYGTARAHAEIMGHSEVASLLQQTLDEESDTNENLTLIADTAVNARAFREVPGMEQE